MATIHLTNSPITITNLHNTEEVVMRLKTYDISNQISPGNFLFNLNPQPVADTLIVTLDGLVLAPSTPTMQKDYTLTGHSQITLHFDEDLAQNSVLLAIYEEA